MHIPITIAIDGHSSCGKSTLARELAAALDYTYVDSGAMYRAVSFYFLENNIDISNPTEVSEAMNQIEIHFETINGEQHIFLNGRNINKQIRDKSVSNIVSEVARISKVRTILVSLQKSLRTGRGIVMDGRDIGTVVFPDADLKLFVTANIDVRSKRRYDELRQKGIQMSLPEVTENLLKRDHIDSTRSDSPLRKADDAILLDNSAMNRTEQLEYTLSLVKEKIANV